jgi:hypothetical protein
VTISTQKYLKTVQLKNKEEKSGCQEFTYIHPFAKKPATTAIFIFLLPWD